LHRHDIRGGIEGPHRQSATRLVGRDHGPDVVQLGDNPRDDALKNLHFVAQTRLYLDGQRLGDLYLEALAFAEDDRRRPAAQGGKDALILQRDTVAAEDEEVAEQLPGGYSIDRGLQEKRHSHHLLYAKRLLDAFDERLCALGGHRGEQAEQVVAAL